MLAAQLVAAAAAVILVRAGSGCPQVPLSDLPPMSYRHRVVLDQTSPFIMLWTPSDNVIDIEIQVSELWQAASSMITSKLPDAYHITRNIIHF